MDNDHTNADGTFLYGRKWLTMDKEWLEENYDKKSIGYLRFQRIITVFVWFYTLVAILFLIPIHRTVGLDKNAS